MDIPFNPAIVAAAESMAGVAYTDAERALVAAMMDEQLALTNALRAIEIGNDVRKTDPWDPESSTLHLAPRALSTGVVDSLAGVLGPIIPAKGHNIEGTLAIMAINVFMTLLSSSRSGLLF